MIRLAPDPAAAGPSSDDLEALANAVREAARPLPRQEPGKGTPGAPVEVARRGHLRMLQDPGANTSEG